MGLEISSIHISPFQLHAGFDPEAPRRQLSRAPLPPPLLSWRGAMGKHELLVQKQALERTSKSPLSRAALLMDYKSEEEVFERASPGLPGLQGC